MQNKKKTKNKPNNEVKNRFRRNKEFSSDTFVKFERDFSRYMITGKSKSSTSIKNVDEKSKTDSLSESLKKLNLDYIPGPTGSNNNMSSSMKKKKTTNTSLNNINDRNKKKNTNNNNNEKNITNSVFFGDSNNNNNKNLDIERNGFDNEDQYKNLITGEESKSKTIFSRKIKSIFLKKLLLEFFAAFVIEFFIILTLITNVNEDRVLFGFVYGFVYMILFYLIQDQTGAQINPAISLAVWFLRLDSRFMTKPSSVLQNEIKKKNKITASSFIIPLTSFARQIVYIIFQFLGTIVGTNIGFLLSGATSINKELSIPSPLDINAIGTVRVFFIELISTSILILVYISTNKNFILFKPIYMGFTIFFLTISIYTLTGASLNPFRWLSPVLFIWPSMQIFVYFWSYITAPLLASFIATFINHLFKL